MRVLLSWYYSQPVLPYLCDDRLGRDAGNQSHLLVNSSDLTFD